MVGEVVVRRPARIPRALPQHNPKPRPQVRSANHKTFIRQLPCAVCGLVPSEAAHIRSGTDGGIGMKPGDRFTLPLCHFHHLEQHSVGERSFYADLGIDPTGLANRLWTVSGDLRAGIRLIERTRLSILRKRYTK